VQQVPLEFAWDSSDQDMSWNMLANNLLDVGSIKEIKIY
jgi:hypothetical protein